MASSELRDIALRSPVIRAAAMAPDSPGRVSRIRAVIRSRNAAMNNAGDQPSFVPPASTGRTRPMAKPTAPNP